MKKCLFILFFLILLMTDFPALELNEFSLFEENNIVITENGSYKTTEEYIFLAYRYYGVDAYSENLIKLAWYDKSTREFNTLVIDDVSQLYQEPHVENGVVLEVISNQEIYVFYLTTEGLNFAKICLDEGVIDSGLIHEKMMFLPYTYSSDGVVNLLLNTSFPPKVHNYEYFTHYEQPYYGNYPGQIRFFGGDIIYGPVHSNDDIWIRNIGGWPQFHGLVTTSGVVRVYPGGHTNFPEDEVFLGGLIQGYPELDFHTAIEIRSNGSWLGSHSDSNIMFVTIEGSTFNAMLGEVHNTGIYDEYIVYDSYPPYGPIGDSIGVNNIARIDTLWSQAGSGSVVDGSVFVPMQLWISGDVGGRQTWGSSHDIYIKDDITLVGTPTGTTPDDIDRTDPDFDPTNPVLGPNYNQNDYFGLVSEQSIYIQYGHWCPIDEHRKRPNTNDIYIYGALVAGGRGEGDTPWFDDGIFSFQYHFPKGSTPDQYYQDTLYSNIDLHLSKYPTTPINPWPPGLDYPWYNPLWPEPGQVYDVPSPPYPVPTFNTAVYAPPGTPQIVKLRGTAHLFGSVAQVRRGFLRRSGNSDVDTGYWDLPNFKFGAPAPSIGPTGYDKNFNYDFRFFHYDNIPDIGYITLKNRNNFAHSFEHSTLSQGQLENLSQIHLTKPSNTYKAIHKDGSIAVLIGNKILISNDNGENYDFLNFIHEKNIQSIALSSGLNILTKELVNEDSYLYRIKKYNPGASNFITIMEIPSQMRYASIFSDNDDFLLYLNFNDSSDLVIHQVFYEGNLMTYVAETNLNMLDENYNNKDSFLSGNLVNGNFLELLFFDNLSNHPTNPNGQLYLSSGYLDPTSTDDFALNLPENTFNFYPNPFNPKINIDYYVNEPGNVNIAVYNLRGQLIKTLVNKQKDRGIYKTTWDGTNHNGSKASSGTYFIRMITDKESEIAKVLLLK